MLENMEQYVSEIITAITALIVAFGAIIINGRRSVRDREVDYNRELCRELFVDFFKVVHTTRRTLDGVSPRTREQVVEVAVEFLHKTHESISLSILVAPAIETHLDNVRDRVLEEAAAQASRIESTPETTKALSQAYSDSRNATDSALSVTAMHMREALGVKAQRAFVKKDRMQIVFGIQVDPSSGKRVHS